MALQIQKGHTYNPGDVVDAPDLNNLVDNASILPGLVMEQTPEVPADVNDRVVLVRGTGPGVLHRALVSTLPTGVTNVTGEGVPATVLGVAVSVPTAGEKHVKVTVLPQNNNKVLAAPVDGSSSNPTFRALATVDMLVPTVAMTALDIDWSLGDVFDKTLPGGGIYIFTFSNVSDGQTIQVRMRQDVSGLGRVNWNPVAPVTLIWNGGSAPVFTTVPNAYGIYHFTAIVKSGTVYVHGYLESSGAVSNVSATATPTSVFGITVANPSTAPAIALSLDNQAANTFLMGPASGADATPAFRALLPADTNGIIDIATGASAINLNLGNVFRKVLSGGAGLVTLHVNNGGAGQKVTVFLIQNATPWNTTVAWTTDDASGVIRWPGGTDHTMSTGTTIATDIVYFFCTGGGQYYGTFDKNFSP